MAALSLSDLKSYVSGAPPRAVSGSVALLDVQHSLIEQRFVEIPFDIFMPLAAVKAKVHSLCGTAPQHQQLHLNSPDGPLLTGSLADCGLRSGSGGGIGCSLYVVDCDPFALGRNGALHDVSQVKKYEMSDEEYGSRSNTYRAFKQKMRQQDPTWKSLYEKPRPRQQEAGEEEEESLPSLQSRFPLLARCQISPGDRRGRIRCQTAAQQHSSTTAQPMRCNRSSPAPPLFSLCCLQTSAPCPACPPPRLQCGSGWSWTSRAAATAAARAAWPISPARPDTVHSSGQPGSR
jgi:hypothetical protein